MTPKFANLEAWRQAELLMQPVFIRVIDNLRKELDVLSSWSGTYRNTEIWEAGVAEETKVLVNALYQELKTAPPETAKAIEQRLEELPKSQPVYELVLSRGDRQFSFDLWQLCYQICFRNYNPVITSSSDTLVEIDLTLLDEFGDVDWTALDTKAKSIIGQIFANLPD